MRQSNCKLPRAQENMMQMRSILEWCSRASPLWSLGKVRMERLSDCILTGAVHTVHSLGMGSLACFHCFHLLSLRYPLLDSISDLSWSFWAEPELTAALVHTYCVCGDCTLERSCMCDYVQRSFLGERLCNHLFPRSGWLNELCSGTDSACSLRQSVCSWRCGPLTRG